MKNLKSKLFGLSAFVIALIVLNACQQEPVIPETIQEDEMMSKITMIMQDDDVQAFMDAAQELDATLSSRIEANQEAYDSYLEAGNYEAINELLSYDEDILPLIDEVTRIEYIVTEKFPDIWEIDASIIDAYRANNIELRWCWHPWYWQCKWNCEYCCAHANDCPAACHELWCT